MLKNNVVLDFLKKNEKLVDKGEMLWYSNIAVGESGALQELQKFLKK